MTEQPEPEKPMFTHPIRDGIRLPWQEHIWRAGTMAKERGIPNTFTNLSVSKLIHEDDVDGGHTEIYADALVVSADRTGKVHIIPLNEEWEEILRETEAP